MSATTELPAVQEVEPPELAWLADFLSAVRQWRDERDPRTRIGPYPEKFVTRQELIDLSIARMTQSGRIARNAASLNGSNPNTGPQAVAFVQLTDGATINTDATRGNSFYVTLGGNRTLANPTGLLDGQIINYRFKQDATGGRTLAYGSMFKFPGGTATPIAAGANAVSGLVGQFHAVDGTIESVVTPGYS